MENLNKYIFTLVNFISKLILRKKENAYYKYIY